MQRVPHETGSVRPGPQSGKGSRTIVGGGCKKRALAKIGCYGKFVANSMGREGNEHAATDHKTEGLFGPIRQFKWSAEK